MLKWLIVLLLVQLSDQQIYDTYRFREIAVGNIAFNDDLTYMAITSAYTVTRPAQIYYLAANGYTFLFPIGSPEGFSNINSMTLSGIDPNVKLTTLNNDNNFRVYSISKNNATHHQTIIFNSSGTIQQSSYYTAAIVSTGTNSTVLRWQSSNNSYVSAFSLTNTAKNRNARAISADGQYFLVDLGVGTTIIYLYTYANGAYTQTASYDIGVSTTTIDDMYIDKQGSDYIALIGYYSSSIYTLAKLSITPTLITSISLSIPLAKTCNNRFLTSNGKYFICGASILVSYYSYDDVMLAFNLIFESSNYISTVGSMYSSKDGKLVAIGSSSNVLIGADLSKYAVLHFQCNITSCSRCKSIGLCQTCATGFVLSGSACLCPPQQYLLGMACISCSPPLCSSCSSANICQTCSQGYVLSSNTCICPSTHTVSLITGLCVSCNVTNCQRCDYENTCSFYASTTGTSVSISSSNSAKDDQSVKEMQIFLVVAVALLLIGFVSAFAFLYRKINDMQLQSRKVNVEASNQNRNSANETKMKIYNHSEVQITSEIVDNGMTKEQGTHQIRKRKVRKEKEREYIHETGDSKGITEYLGSKEICFPEETQGDLIPSLALGKKIQND